MADKRPPVMTGGSKEFGPLQVLTHFGGEFDRRADGSIRGYERNDGVVGVDTNTYYRDFVRAMAEIGYEGYISYELCHQLPVEERSDGRH